MSGQRKNKRSSAIDITIKPTINFKAGASVDCLQAYAGGGSGLTKGKHGN